MCARFRSIADLEAIQARYGFKQKPNWSFNPNVAITDTVPILRSSKSEGLKLELAKFGLIPSWAKDVKIGARFYNARSESIDTTKTYIKPFLDCRCIIPALGFYEWSGSKDNRIPFMVHRKDNQPMPLAGIWDFADINGEKIYSFAIITSSPSALTEPLHDRTPIILDDPEGWIKEGGKKYLTIPDDRELTITEKNPAMNNTRMKDINQIDAPAQLLF